ncbi:hypothetical protein AYO20_09978 [Fonsecaea nubica]|uniref:Uncharacterized protein n=1 Tax=Fonsecaea nubica TaxID=856822 RepID=A0A178CAR7_9EURO|nr:hypothetical protein AYO20_09978 [Fonsecaea nubica]OAL26637.1 hypothetical protein AYO20_09978 [Fonsecaea nubica]
MHPAKKRKLHQPGGFLNKPFRSPLRPTNTQPQPSAQGAHTQVPAAALLSDCQRLSPDIKPDIRPNSRITTTQQSSSLLSPDESALRDLQKQYTTLSNRLTHLRQSLQTAEHALQIEGSKQNAEVQSLVSRWRTIAQDAADELFADAKQRVDMMGGVVQWRRQLEEDSRLWNNAESEAFAPKSAGEVEDDHGKRETEEADHANTMDAESNIECSETCFFTMEMMLNQMNVDLQLIGFDKNQECWI